MPARIDFQTDPARYRHWKLAVEGETATLIMQVEPHGGARPGYELKLNSYDIGVDVELNDATTRLRFEQPQVKVVVVKSGLDRVTVEELERIRARMPTPKMFGSERSP